MTVISFQLLHGKMERATALATYSGVSYVGASLHAFAEAGCQFNWPVVILMQAGGELQLDADVGANRVGL